MRGLVGLTRNTTLATVESALVRIDHSDPGAVRVTTLLDGLATPHGVALEPGQVILAGSFTAPIFVGAGDTVHVDYGALGAVTMSFA